MPRLFPEHPRFPADYGAERAVWQALHDQLPDDAALFAGRRLLANGEERELDLVVAWPGVGIATIEVKGGHITHEAGAWFQGSGSNRHRISPVEQVQDARHLLTTMLSRRRLAAAYARTAHLVSFPQFRVPRDWEIAEAPREIVIDRDDLPTAAQRVKHAIEHQGAGHRPLDTPALEGLVDLLAGTMPTQLELLSEAAAHEDRVEQLTRDQARILDMLRDHPRLRVIGGAGSGKTWLALEQARRRAKAGERVALLCYSRGLARYLERVTENWPRHQRPAYVGLFHDLPRNWGAEAGADDDSDYWEIRLPAMLGKLAAGRSRSELFDSVVVDEAQDFGEQWWISLMQCLRDPHHGGLFVFMDEAQQVFGRSGAVPIAAPPIVLDENLRSTKQIAQVFGAFTDDHVRPRGGAGPRVRLVEASPNETIRAGDSAVEALLDEGWRPGQIALLTTGTRHEAQRIAVEHSSHQAYWGAFFDETDVFYGHVLGFKGLERTVVVLVVNGFRDEERARKLLYTGLSRARVLLVVVGPRQEIERLGGPAVVRRLRDAEEWPLQDEDHADNEA
ncbi:NERD domain-containing protein [Cellulomonas sp. ATA003]|uniref:NERD domain-containing protein n=1 Tax=Cellulomonas sp. ATA003 TaxID=3073064 RepID=UPI002872BBF1|nr:NERD domain-containing protein [Cellulomonas sp. ATA003]WNB86469.1 NERD domain-containing protein [Cellulomonas sp. ATA003]